MKSKIIIAIFAFVAFVVATSCKKDLDLFPPNDLTTERKLFCHGNSPHKTGYPDFILKKSLFKTPFISSLKRWLKNNSHRSSLQRDERRLQISVTTHPSSTRGWRWMGHSNYGVTSGNGVRFTHADVPTALT